MPLTGQKKPLNINRAAAQEWILTWRTATPNNLGELEEISDVEGVRAVEDAVNEYFQEGFKNGRFKLWYFHSEGHTFAKVIVAENKPDYDMILTGDWPALGMIMLREEDTDIAALWKDLANQIKEKARQ